MKKILFIIWSYSYGGGAEGLLTNIVNKLNPEKYQIDIIEYYSAGIKKEPINSNINFLGGITYGDDPEYTKKLYYTHMKSDVMIKKYIPDGYDLYVAFNYQIPTFLLPHGTKNIAWIHNDILYDFAEKNLDKYRELQLNSLNNVEKIVSVCTMVTNSIMDFFPFYTDKIVEIKNNINIDIVRNNSKEKTAVILNNPSIVYVGRLENRKNPLYMLEVFKEIYKIRNDIHLYFLGHGDLKQDVIEKSEEYNISTNVHLLGYIDNPFPIIKQSDVLCLFSKEEGFGNVFIEAIVLGVPFVASPIGAAEELSNNHTCGKIVESIDEAVNEILSFVDGNKEEIKQMCFESAKRLDMNNYISKIEALFDEVMEEPKREQRIAYNCNADLVELPYYYQFPTDLIEKGSNIILYGAGRLGTDFYSYILTEKYCNVVGWIDSNKSGTVINDFEISGLDKINEFNYDYVLIAVCDESVAEKIKTSLLENGVNKEKIIWKSVFFRED